jgi:hypothetical protein
MKTGWRPARFLALAAVVALGCRAARAVPQLEDRTFFTCCNIHYEDEEVSDANYWVGKRVPPGSLLRIDEVAADSVTILTENARLKLTHEYGGGAESFQKYLDKLLLKEDPRPRIAAFPKAVQRAIENSKVERGMTREQVIFSLGHPPAHRTPSLDSPEWTYWYNRWVTYKVVFDDAGKVADVVGRPAPTAEVPIRDADRPPKPDKKKPATKRKGK